MKLRQFIREHSWVTILLIMECIVIIWAFGLLFGRRTVIEADLADADYYNSCSVTDGKLVIKQSDNADGVSTASAGYGGLNLRPGRYEIRAEYSADIEGYDASKWNGGSDIPMCNIGVSSSTFIVQLVGNGFNISYGTTENVEPFWINSFTRCRDLSLNIAYQGYGDVTIKKLEIVESVYFRFVRLLAVITVITGINFFVFLCLGYIKCNKKAVLGIAAVTLFSSLPMLYRYIYVGHDLTFHIARIAEIAEGIRHGNWLIKIQPDMINGYGYATPLFYPQLFLYIPALLNVAGFPLQTSYQMFIVLINFATCMISYCAIVRITKNRRAAFIGSLLYTIAPYRLSELYVAGRLGEILSMVFFPLIIYGIYLVYADERVTLKKCIPLIIGVSGVMQSHLVSMLFVGIFAVLFAILNIKKTFKARRLCYLAASVVIVLMLNAWFVVPFMDSMDMDILVNGSGTLWFQGSGVYPIQVFSLFYYGKGTNVPMFASGEFCLTMGVPLIIGIALWVYVYYRCHNTDKKNEGLYVLGQNTALFAAMTIVFSLWIFPWDEINNISGTLAVWLAKVEFSWRFLSVGAAFAAFAAAAAMCYTEKLNNRLCRTAVICMSALSIISAGFFYADLSFESAGAQIYSMNQIDGFALGVTNDYQLAGTDLASCRSRNVEVTSDKLDIRSYDYEGGVTTVSVKNSSEGFEKIILPLFNYDGYRAYDTQTGERYYIESGDNKRLMVNVPAGYDGTITVKYTEKGIWHAAEAVSLLTLVLLAAVLIKYRKCKNGITK